MRTLKDRAFRCTKKRDSVEVDAAVGASWIGLGWRPREIGKPKRFWKGFLHFGFGQRKWVRPVFLLSQPFL